jgi:hypothetical protein
VSDTLVEATIGGTIRVSGDRTEEARGADVETSQDGMTCHDGKTRLSGTTAAAAPTVPASARCRTAAARFLINA